MAEMGRVSRFFVNRFNARRSARIGGWIRENAANPDGAICLEIGCGNGELAARVVDGAHPSRYVATDLDPRQLDAAREHLAERYPGGLPRSLELQQANMLQLAFGDASFDAVLAVVSIHHASPNHHDPANVPAALAEIHRVLRAGGALVYEEILHKEVVRSWLMAHGYTLGGIQRGFKRESVIARKPGGAAESHVPHDPSS